MTFTAPRTMASGDRRSDRRVSPAGSAFLAASTEMAVALVAFAAAIILSPHRYDSRAGLGPMCTASSAIRTCSALASASE